MKHVLRLFLVIVFLSNASALWAGPVGPSPMVGRFGDGHFYAGGLFSYDRIPLVSRAQSGNDFEVKRSMFLAHLGWIPRERTEFYVLLGSAASDLTDKADGTNPTQSEFDGSMDGIAGAGVHQVLWMDPRGDLRLSVNAQLLMQNNIGLLETTNNPVRRSINYDSLEWHVGADLSTSFNYEFRSYLGVRASGFRYTYNTPAPGFGDLEQKNRLGLYGGIDVPFHFGRSTVLHVIAEGRVIDEQSLSLHANVQF